MFDSSDRLAFDGCAVMQRDIDSRLAASYTLTNLRPAPPPFEDKAANKAVPAPLKSSLADGQTVPAPLKSSSSDDFALAHRNLRKWDGYGPSGARVDGDTKLRLEAERTRPRARLQLCSRVFSAAPNLSKARGESGLEARVMTGVDTSCSRRAPGLRMSEADFDRFDPAVAAVPVEHIVPAWTAGGASSRDIARTKKFRKALGCAEADDGTFGAIGGVSGATLAADTSKSWRRLVSLASSGFKLPQDGFGAGSGI